MPYAKVLLMLTIVAMLAACGKGKKTMLPDSGGRPYEVVVAGDNDSTLSKALAATTAPLPQPEPMLDVSLTKKLNAPLNIARNIVVVDVNSSKHKQTKITYKHNVYAEPQMIIYVATPSHKQLKYDITTKAVAKTITDLLRHNEIVATAEQLQYKHNPKMEDLVRKMFGIDMRLPSDMKASLKGNDFLWISNDSPTAMTNICIYTSENRDSVMKRNIKGETDDMYMTTVPGSIVKHTERKGTHTICVSQGLWEMKGDAMGGPFVSHTFKDSKGKTIVVEAFVFAPGLKKRNIMLQPEAALYTIK